MADTNNGDPLCPECGVADGFEPIGRHRSMCVVCGALLKNEEIDRSDPSERIEGP